MSEKTTNDRKNGSASSTNIYGRGRNIDKLNERVKELNCLYGLTKIVRNDKLTSDQVFSQILNLIPPSWQYPEITCARIIVEGHEVKTENFKETPWMQSKEIISEGRKIGVLEVYYLQRKPDQDQGPFLTEERWLIDAIADLLGKYID